MKASNPLPNGALAELSECGQRGLARLLDEQLVDPLSISADGGGALPSGFIGRNYILREPSKGLTVRW